MSNAQMIEAFANKLSARVTYRMEIFGDTYAKAKSMVQLESVAGDAVWAILDARFA